MRITLGISGPAGGGVFTAGTLVCEILADLGYFVIGDKEYSSVIKGGNNLFTISISYNGYYFSKQIDYFMYFNDYALDNNQENYSIKNSIKIEKNLCNYQNAYAIGLIGKLLGIEKQIIIDKIKTQYKADSIEKNVHDIENAYNSSIDNIFQTTPKDKKSLYFGNEILAKGALASGLHFYGAYPMTPASSIIEVIIKDKNVVFYQGEDEIAVAMAMLGAKFAGKRSMCGSSGGGFALMSESISFANQAEIGGVYILSQRAGPSTGTPTFTEQSDINYGLNASFGETYPIVIYPSSFEDGFNLIGKALNWSDIYQHPVIVLTEKVYSESYVSVSENDLIPQEIDRGKLIKNPSQDFARYQFSDNGISPYTVPGTPNGEFIASSYEHNEYGASVENSQNKIRMTDKRLKKLDTLIENEFNESFFGYEIINGAASNIYITVGFNSYGVKSFIQDKPQYGLIIIKILSPFDKRLKKFLEENENNIQNLIFVEQNATGQLQDLVLSKLDLTSNNWNQKIKSIRKYDLYPVYQEDLLIKEKKGEQI
ncbi:MAG: 2-oxoacid:acceptor oxidoreductase family protein [Candidatus Absconditabacteria bacterium]